MHLLAAFTAEKAASAQQNNQTPAKHKLADPGDRMGLLGRFDECCSKLSCRGKCVAEDVPTSAEYNETAQIV